MTNSFFLRSAFAWSLSLLVGMLLLFLPSAKGASGTWNLSGNGVWSGSTNWLGNVIADGAGSTGDFSTFNILANTVVTMDTTSRTLGTLTIGDPTGNQQYTIDASGGATLTMNNSGSGALISRTQAGTTTISVPIILADDLTIRKEGTNAFNINGGITSIGGTRNLVLENNTNQALNFGSSSTLNHVGSITNIGSGGGATSISASIGANVTEIIQNSASSTMSLGTGNSAFIGSVSVQNGTLSTGNNSLNVNNLVTMSANGIFENNASSGLTIAGLSGAGGIVQGGNTTNLRSLTLGGSGTSSYSGVIADKDFAGGGFTSITKSGLGTQILSGTNTYTGATTVTAGTLIIEGSLGNTVVSVTGGILGGSGTIGGSVTVSTGTLAPGSSPGTLTVNDDLTMDSGSTYLFEAGDLTNVTGQLDLNNTWTLSLAPSANWQVGGTTVLFEYGTLAASPWLTPAIVDNTGLGGILTVTDNGSQIILNGYSVVPEPAAVLMAGLGLTLVLLRRRLQLRS